MVGRKSSFCHSRACITARFLLEASLNNPLLYLVVSGHCTSERTLPSVPFKVLEWNALPVLCRCCSSRLMKRRQVGKLSCAVSASAGSMMETPVLRLSAAFKTCHLHTAHSNCLPRIPACSKSGFLSPATEMKGPCAEWRACENDSSLQEKSKCWFLVDSLHTPSETILTSMLAIIGQMRHIQIIYPSRDQEVTSLSVSLRADSNEHRRGEMTWRHMESKCSSQTVLL